MLSANLLSLYKVYGTIDALNAHACRTCSAIVSPPSTNNIVLLITLHCLNILKFNATFVTHIRRFHERLSFSIFRHTALLST